MKNINIRKMRLKIYTKENLDKKRSIEMQLEAMFTIEHDSVIL